MLTRAIAGGVSLGLGFWDEFWAPRLAELGQGSPGEEVFTIRVVKHCTDCLERWWMLHPREHPRSDLTQLGAAWSRRCPCSWQGLDQMTFKGPFTRFLPTQPFHDWFHNLSCRIPVAQEALLHHPAHLTHCGLCCRRMGTGYPKYFRYG